MTLTPNAWGFVFVNMVAMSLAMVFIGKGDTVILGTHACFLFWLSIGQTQGRPINNSVAYAQVFIEGGEVGDGTDKILEKLKDGDKPKNENQAKNKAVNEDGVVAKENYRDVKTWCRLGVDFYRQQLAKDEDEVAALEAKKAKESLTENERKTLKSFNNQVKGLKKRMKREAVKVAATNSITSVYYGFLGLTGGAPNHEAQRGPGVNGQLQARRSCRSAPSGGLVFSLKIFDAMLRDACDYGLWDFLHVVRFELYRGHRGDINCQDGAQWHTNRYQRDPKHGERKDLSLRVAEAGFQFTVP